MAPWQLLRARGALRPGGGGGGGVIGGYRVNHGASVCVRHSTAAGPACSRGLSGTSGAGEKLTMQELNRRLASYMDKVQSLEAANEQLERQIQDELDRKSVADLRELDGPLQTVSLLQAQISECQAAQGQVKLQLLSAELDAFDFTARCEGERERRAMLEADLRDLRLMEEELKVRRLPDLQGLLGAREQELQQLHLQHQQDIQGLRAQLSGGVTVEMQRTESLDLKQQLQELRQRRTVLVTKNQKQNDCWFNAQVSMLSSQEATCRPEGSEVNQAELNEMRRTALNLQTQLTQLQAQNVLLEDNELELREGFSLQLASLQQRAHSLGGELESVLEAAGRQAADYQALLDIKTRLETEIQDYKRLLDGQGTRAANSCSDSVAGGPSFCATTTTAALQSKEPLDKTVSVEGNLEIRTTQAVTSNHISSACQATVVNPLSQPIKVPASNHVNTFQKVHNKHPSSSPPINTTNLTGLSRTSSQSQRQGVVTGNVIKAGKVALPKSTERESMKVNRQSSALEDNVHTTEPKLKTTVIVGSEISKDIDDKTDIRASKPEINSAKVITRLAPDVQSPKKGSVQAPKPEIYLVTEITNTDHDTSAIQEAVCQATKQKINVTGMTSAVVHTQITKEAGVQAPKTELNTVTEITKTVPGTQTTKEEATKAEINSVTEMTGIHPDTKTSADVEKEGARVTVAVISTQMAASKDKDPEFVKKAVVALSTEGPVVTERSQVSAVGRTEVVVEAKEVDNKAKINSTPAVASAVNTEESVKEKVVCHSPNTEENIMTTHASPTETNDKSVKGSDAVSHISTTEQSLLTVNTSNAENNAETIKPAGSDSPRTEVCKSTPHVRKSKQSQGEISSEGTLVDQRKGEKVKIEEEQKQGKMGKDKTEMRDEEVEKEGKTEEAGKPEINTAKVITRLAPDVQSPKKGSVQAPKPEIYIVTEITNTDHDTSAIQEAVCQATKQKINVTGMTSAVVHTQITKEAGVQAPKTELNTLTEITKTVPGTQTTKGESSKAEINSVKKVTSIDGGYVQATSKGKDPEFVNEAVVALSTKSPVVTERSQVSAVCRSEVAVEAKEVDNKAKISSTPAVASAVNTEESVKEKAVCHSPNTEENIMTTHASPSETNDKSVKGSGAVSHISTTEQSLLTANTSNAENNAAAIKPAGSDSPRTEVFKSTPHVRKSEQSQGEISSEGTLVDQRDVKIVKKEEEQKQGKKGKDQTEMRDEEVEKERKTREGGKPEINTAKVITRLAPDVQSPKKGSVQAPKPEIYIVTEITNTDHDTSAIQEAVCQATKQKINVTGMTSAVVHTQITKEAGVQAPKTELNTVTEITKTVPGTQTTKGDAVKATEAEINSAKKLTSIDGDYVPAVSKDKDPEFVKKAVVALSTKGPMVTERSQVSTVCRSDVVDEATEVDNKAKLNNTPAVATAVKSVKEKAVCYSPNTAENIEATGASPTETNDKSVKGSDAVSHVSTTEQSLLTANTSNAENNAEAIKPAGSDSPKAEVSMSTSHVHRSEQSRGEISCEVTLVDQREVKKEEEQKLGKKGKDNTEMRDEEVEKEGKSREGGKPEINTAKVITRLAADVQSPKKGSVQAPKPEIYIVTEITNTDHDTSAIQEAVCQATKQKINVTGMTSAVVHTQITKEAGVQAPKTETEITKTAPGTQTTTIKEDAVKATKVEISAKSVEGSDVSRSSTTEQSILTANISNTKNTAEAIKSAGEILTLGEDEKQAKKGREQEGDKTEMRKEEDTSLISKLEQGLLLGDTFSSKQNTEVLEGAEVRSSIPLNDAETVKPAGQGTSPVSGEVFLDPANQELCPVDLEVCISPNDSELSQSPVEAEFFSSPNDEEECMNLTEANECVKTVEKYVLSTKEESQSLSSGRDQTSSEKHTAAKVTSPVKNENNLGFRSVGDLAGRRDDLSSAKTGLRLGSHVQVRSTLGDSLYRSSLETQDAVASMVGRTSVGDKKEMTRPGERHKDPSDVDSKGFWSPGGRFRKLSHGDKEDTTISSMGRSAWGPSALNSGTKLKNSSLLAASTAPNSDGVFGKSAISGRVPAPGGTGFIAQNAGGKINGTDHSRGISVGGMANSACMVSGTATSLGAVTAHSEGTVNGIYGSRTGYLNSLPGISRLASAETGGDTVSGSVVSNQETSSDRAGRIGRIGGSGEWKVYSGGTGRASSAGSADGDDRVTSPPLVYHRSSSTGSGGRLSSGGSGGRLSTSLGGSGRLSSCARRSVSVGSGGRLSSSGSVPSSAANQRVSSSGRYGSTGSGEWKPVYGGASGRSSSVGSGGRPVGTSRTPSPGGRLTITGGSGGWLTSTTVSSNRISSAGSGSKLSGAGSNDRLSGQAGGRISSSSGSGRTNSTGGRVITSSDGPIRSTGSGVGANKERISVCKMAALSMSAAGMERSKERQRQAKKSQQEQAAANRPHVQRWLTSGVGVTGSDPDGLDDIIRL